MTIIKNQNFFTKRIIYSNEIPRTSGDSTRYLPNERKHLPIFIERDVEDPDFLKYAGAILVVTRASLKKNDSNFIFEYDQRQMEISKEEALLLYWKQFYSYRRTLNAGPNDPKECDFEIEKPRPSKKDIILEQNQVQAAGSAQ